MMNRDGWTNGKLSPKSDSGAHWVNAGKVQVADCSGDDVDEATAKANAHRLADCWNAMLPFDNPSALVASWLALREALKDARREIQLVHMKDRLVYDPTLVTCIDTALAEAQELER